MNLTPSMGAPNDAPAQTEDVLSFPSWASNSHLLSPEAFEDYLASAALAGCPPDQAKAFLNAGLVLQPRQLAASVAARACDHPDGPTAVGYGGARGGGKSFWLLAQMGADDCQRYPGLKCLLLRKVGKSNLEGFEDLRRRVFPLLPHTVTHRGVLTFRNGSRILAGHFQYESDIDSYLGLEYDVIGIEEATTLTRRKHEDITTCCRTSKPNWRPRIYSTTNPGGVGHAWYRHRFVDPFQYGIERETRFVPARSTDNRFLDTGYRRNLENLSGWQKRAWCDGDWNIAAGQFFTHFRPDAHVIQEVDETRAVEWFCALDYGFTHFTAVCLGFKDGDGTIFVVDEHAERHWLPERHAVAIRAMLKRHHLTPRDLSRFVAGTDVFSCQSNGSSVAKQYLACGLRLTEANVDRINGWAEILRRLGDPEAGLPPTLFIHRRCARILQTLPNLQHDPIRPEDVLKRDCDDEGEGGDDAADALRYLVHTQPRRVHERKLTGL